MNEPEVNSEDMTWDEWRNAALAWCSKNITPEQESHMKECWRDGQDPCQYNVSHPLTGEIPIR